MTSSTSSFVVSEPTLHHLYFPVQMATSKTIWLSLKFLLNTASHVLLPYATYLWILSTVQPIYSNRNGKMWLCQARHDFKHKHDIFIFKLDIVSLCLFKTAFFLLPTFWWVPTHWWQAHTGIFSNSHFSQQCVGMHRLCLIDISLTLLLHLWRLSSCLLLNFIWFSA